MNLQEVSATLRPGCSPADLDSFENEFGLILPDEVKESFRRHDGQEEHTYPGAIAGQPFDSLERVRYGLVSWRQLYEQELQTDHDSEMIERFTSYPAHAIRCEDVAPNWIPLGDWDGNCYGIDLNPGPNGVPGQVINFGRDQDNKYVLALSWAHFLEDIVDEFEAGNLVPSRGPEGEVEHFGRPGQPDQALCGFYKEWSEAKLPSSFQVARPAVLKPVVPGKVIENEEAARAFKLVRQFIEAMHAFEMKWLGIRPIHELGWRLIVESESGHMAQGLLTAKRRVPIDNMELQKYRKHAIREKKAILNQFGTPRKRMMANSFVQLYPVAYDPKRDRLAEVREVSPDYLLVYMHPVEGVTTRYHLKQEGGKWLIDLKDRTSDQVRFEKKSL